MCLGLDIWVPQIVKANIRQSQLFHNELEAVIHRSIGETAPGGIGEHKAGFFPCLPGFQAVSVLFQLLPAEQLNHGGSQGQDTALVVLGRGEIIFPALFLLPAELTLDGKGLVVQVDVLPAQAQKLTLTHTREQSDLEKVFMGMPLDFPEERLRLFPVQRLDFLPVNPGQFASVREVEPQDVVFLGLFQSLVKNAVDVFDRLGGKSPAAVLLGAEKLIVKLLNLVRGQGFNFQSPQLGNNVHFRLLAVEQRRGGLHIPKVVRQPVFKPLFHGELAWGLVGPFIKFSDELRELLPDLLWGLSGNGFLDLLSCSGVVTHSSAGLPKGVFFTVSHNGFLANGPVAVGGAAHGFCARHIF